MQEGKHSSILVLIIILFAIAAFGISFHQYKINLKLQPNQYSATDSVYYVADTIDNIPYNFKVTQVFKPNENQVLFHSAPAFLVWIMVVLVMITVAAGSFPVFALQAWNLKKSFRFPNWQFILLGGVSVGFVILLAIMPQIIPGYIKPIWLVEKFKVLLHNPSMIKYSVFTTLLLIIPILLVIFMTGPASDKISIDSRSRESFETAALKLNTLLDALLTALQVLAVIVVLAVLSSRALYESIRSVIRIENVEFPREVSYIYGLYFSLFLAIVYIPSYYYLRMRSSSLRQSLDAYLSDQPSKEDSRWPEKMATAFTIKTTPVESLKLALTVLAPLISSLLPEGLFK